VKLWLKVGNGAAAAGPVGSSSQAARANAVNAATTIVRRFFIGFSGLRWA
jgi:hypothetical protein